MHGAKNKQTDRQTDTHTHTHTQLVQWIRTYHLRFLGYKLHYWPCHTAAECLVALYFPMVDVFQDDFTWVINETDFSIVLKLLRVAFWGYVMIVNFIHGVGHSSVKSILLQTDVSSSMMYAPLACTNSSGTLSTRCLPFIKDLDSYLHFFFMVWTRIV